MKIEFDALSVSSIEKAMQNLDKYIKKLRRLETELPEALAEYGAEDAQVRYDNAAFNILVDGFGSNPFIKVEAIPVHDGYVVHANGAQVCFVEFGAGVWFNGDEPYLGERPSGIVGIGEWGKGKGKRKAWMNPWGELTHGTPASNTLYFTVRDMADRVAEEARRILNDD